MTLKIQYVCEKKKNHIKQKKRRKNSATIWDFVSLPKIFLILSCSLVCFTHDRDAGMMGAFINLQKTYFTWQVGHFCDMLVLNTLRVK